MAEDNDQTRQLDLDLLDERREVVALRMAQYKNVIAQYYNARVKHLYVKLGDLALRKNSKSRAEPLGKLNPKWKGPYRVADVGKNSYYKLAY